MYKIFWHNNRYCFRMKYFLFFLALLFLNTLQAQIELSDKIIDYGVINQQSLRIADITITNKGKEKTFLLRTDFNPEFKILFSSNNRSIAPDSSIVLRVRFDPRKEGSFKIKNSLWFATEDKPITITFKGEVQYIYNSYNTPCPDFSENPTRKTDQNDLEIVVIDKISREKIKNARIRIVEQGLIQKTLFTNKKGESKLNNVPISYYYLLVDAKNYLGVDTALYINRMTGMLQFELEKQYNDVVEENKPQENNVVVEEVKPEENSVIEVEENTEQTDENILVVDESSALPESKYKKNNIVFLIDVSQSMNQKGKLDLLKSSMLSLVDILRESDDITIITYATNPKIILPTTSGIDKNKTKEIIKNLKAGGATSGSKGFKMAYEEVLSHLLVDGNNQVIVATDGAFKEEDNPKIIRLVKKHQNKNIKTSVIGIKSNSKTSEKLNEISTLGNGSFIYIEDYDASKAALIEEIKKQSRI